MIPPALPYKYARLFELGKSEKHSQNNKVKGDSYWIFGENTH
jgi:hypothetical protein